MPPLRSLWSTNDPSVCSAPTRSWCCSPAVLKLGMPHMEARDEIVGLRFWDGDPTVRVLDSDLDRNAVLLERCVPGTALRELPEPEQDAVVASLLRQLWRKPPQAHSFRPLEVMIDYWLEESGTQAVIGANGLQAEAYHILRELAVPSESDVLLATDLHAGNVLRAQRKPWLVSDPKPFVGDPAYDATQHLLNCRARLIRDPLGTIGRFSDLVEVDDERVRFWTFARIVLESVTEAPDSAREELMRRLAR